jgi:hypothetical protein
MVGLFLNIGHLLTTKSYIKSILYRVWSAFVLTGFLGYVTFLPSITLDNREFACTEHLIIAVNVCDL